MGESYKWSCVARPNAELWLSALLLLRRRCGCLMRVYRGS